MNTRKLWEVLVPANGGYGRAIKKLATHEKQSEVEPRIKLHHQKWDEQVRSISKGLTILRSSKGQWVDKGGRVIKELVIPVRIACTRKQFIKILELTKKHYCQDVVVGYRLSDEVFFYGE